MAALRSVGVLFVALGCAAQTPPPQQAGGSFASATTVSAQETEQWEAAYRDRAAAVKRSPGVPGAWLALAHAAQRAGKLQEAAIAADKAVALAPRDQAVLRGAAVIFVNLANRIRAAQLEEKIAAVNPQDRDALPRAVSFYLDANAPDKAAEVAARAQKDDVRPAVLALYAKALSAANRNEEAEKVWRNVIERDPYDETYWVDYAQSLLRQQKFDEALAVLDDASKVYSRSGRIELARGVAYYAQRRFAEAVDQFLKAMDLAPALPMPYIFLGRVLEHAGPRLPEIIARFAAIARSAPGAWQSHFLLGKALAVQLPPNGEDEQAARAEAELRRAAELNPEFWETYYQLGLLLERRREFEGAREALAKAAKLNPDDPAPHYRLSRVLARLGLRDEAAAERELHEKLVKSRRDTMQGMSANEPLP